MKSSWSTCASLVLATSLLAACGTKPPATVVEEDEAAKAETKPAPNTTEPAKSNELTPEELELIETDPKTLTPEKRRARAYAIRKQVMQDPGSPQAKALEEMRQAALAGELNEQLPEDKNKDAGMIIPAPPHLRSDDQAVSHDEPVDTEAAPAQ